MKKKIFTICMCIILGMATGIIRTKAYANTAPLKDENTIVANDTHVKLSKLTFKHDKNNRTEIIGSITNTSIFDADVRFEVTFSEIDETKTGTYKYMINSQDIKAGETVKFNVSSYNINLRNKKYKIKLIDLDSKI